MHGCLDTDTEAFRKTAQELKKLTIVSLFLSILILKCKHETRISDWNVKLSQKKVCKAEKISKNKLNPAGNRLNRWFCAIRLQGSAFEALILSRNGLFSSLFDWWKLIIFPCIFIKTVSMSDKEEQHSLGIIEISGSLTKIKSWISFKQMNKIFHLTVWKYT